MLNSIVSVQWLKCNLKSKKIVVLYTTLVAKKTIIPVEIKNQQIKGARFFDLQKVFSLQDSDLPNTYPPEEQFEDACKNLGIDSNSKIVVYDSLGIYSSPRVWFLFKSMGHEEVFVLDGGLQEWVRQGCETVKKREEELILGNFKARPGINFMVSQEEVRENISSQEALVIDARSGVRFRGEVSEPRKGQRSGNILGSKNLHYAALLKEGNYKSEEALKSIFAELVKGDEPLIFSCGSGITACILYLAADSIIENSIAVYDGSWTEWGQKVKN
ncbi:MAG: sulfurtransferase [Flavobacteriales bacterium]|nr:sulfurtransferase [Flavobacteriales bacterium]